MNDEDDGDDEPADDAGESADEGGDADDGEGPPPGDGGETAASDRGEGGAAGQRADEAGSRDEPAVAGASADPLAGGDGETSAAGGDPLASDDDRARTSERTDDDGTRGEEGTGGDESDAGGTGAGVAVEDATTVDSADEAAAEATVDPSEVERAIQEKERGRTPSAEETAATAEQTESAHGAVESTDAPGEARADASDGGARQRSVSVAVVTVSRDRTHDDDPAGEAIEEALADRGHEVVTRELLRPTYDTVQQSLDALVSRGDVDAVVTNGATGVTQDDVTVEALHPLIEKALPGFGEVFRSRYYEAVGTDVVASRATAGIADGTPIFCLPADPTAVRLGVDEIVAEQAPEIVDAIEADGPADE